MSCKFCEGTGRKCGDIKTKDITVAWGADLGKMKSEVWQCTRKKGHTGKHVACWDEDVEDGYGHATGKIAHISKVW